jgi:hypothetical protein
VNVQFCVVEGWDRVVLYLQHSIWIEYGVSGVGQPHCWTRPAIGLSQTDRTSGSLITRLDRSEQAGNETEVRCVKIQTPIQLVVQQ